MGTLSDILDYFNNVDDEEVFRLIEQAISIYGRVNGYLSEDVASSRHKLGIAYLRKVLRAFQANDVERCLAILDIALPHYHEAARIYRAIDRMDSADAVLHSAAYADVNFRRIITNRVVPAAVSASSAVVEVVPAASAAAVVEVVSASSAVAAVVPAAAAVVEVVPAAAVVEVVSAAAAVVEVVPAAAAVVELVVEVPSAASAVIPAEAAVTTEANKEKEG